MTHLLILIPIKCSIQAVYGSRNVNQASMRVSSETTIKCSNLSIRPSCEKLLKKCNIFLFFGISFVNSKMMATPQKCSKSLEFFFVAPGV